MSRHQKPVWTLDNIYYVTDYLLQSVFIWAIFVPENIHIFKQMILCQSWIRLAKIYYVCCNNIVNSKIIFP
jgi:hypothetical protein